MKRRRRGIVEVGGIIVGRWEVVGAGRSSRAMVGMRVRIVAHLILNSSDQLYINLFLLLNNYLSSVNYKINNSINQTPPAYFCY